MYASMKGHEEVVRVLLSAGAKVDLRDKVSNSSNYFEWCLGKVWFLHHPIR